LPFINKTKLPHLLRPDQYTSEAQYEDEMKRLLLPAWHLVATTHDLPKPGDYLTFELLRQPVLLRNMGGDLRAFLNVCAHRHSRLVKDAHGSSERLRCQYHGWEYNAEGRTGRIPNAQCFRPFDRENACLQQFRVATCGQLVFVALTPNGPTLEEYLGPLYAGWRESFDAPFRFAGSWKGEFDCNWKVAVENALEDYHVPLLHPKTFRTYAEEEQWSHVLTDGYTTCTRPIKSKDSRFGRAVNWLIRWVGGTRTNGTYEHQIIHPHLMLAGTDVGRFATIVDALSPTTCRFRMYCFTLRGERNNPAAQLVGWLLRVFVVALSKRVFREDASIYAEIQRGLAASPFRGVIGTREERVFAFQQFVSQGCPRSEHPPVDSDLEDPSALLGSPPLLPSPMPT
jgi:phenylpropionate dioxygenase-like ring-hydroxylating dioxygenase large terminal subunit